MVFGGVYSQTCGSWGSLLRKASHEPEKGGLSLRSSERARIPCQTALVWKGLLIPFLPGKTELGKHSCRLKLNLISWNNCTQNSYPPWVDLFQISAGFMDCPGIRGKRHFRSDIIAAEQVASSSILTIPPISLSGRGSWGPSLFLNS